MSIDLHEVGLGLLIAASILSLLLLIAKALGKEFEDTAIVWIRTFKRIRAELRPNEQSSPQRLPLSQTRSKRELSSGDPVSVPNLGPPVSRDFRFLS